MTAAALHRLAGARQRRNVVPQALDVIAIAREGHVRHVERAEQQRRIGQVDLLVREAADDAERTLDRLTGHR